MGAKKKATKKKSASKSRSRKAPAKASKALTREDILSANDVEIVRVETPKWGGHVHIKTMTGASRDRFELWSIDHATAMKEKYGDLPVPNEELLSNLRARLLAASICDEDGNLLFTMGDVERLGRKCAATMDRCYAVASRLNAVSKADLDSLAGK